MKIIKLKEKLFNLSLGAIIVALFYVFNIVCPIKYFLNIPCPSCGMTRAYLSLVKLDFASAFYYNAMFWSVPLLILLYLFDGKLFSSKWINLSLNVIILIGFLLNWIFMLLK